MNLKEHEARCENGDYVFTIDFSEDEVRPLIDAGIKMFIACGLTGKTPSDFLSAACEAFHENIQEADDLIEEIERNEETE